VGGSRPLIDIAGRSSLRVARSTLIASQTLVHVGRDSKGNEEPAVQWLGWDSLLARFGSKNGGNLLALDEGASLEAIQWHTVNCLYAGWESLLKTSKETISQSDLRAHFGLGPSTRIDSVEVSWPSGVRQEFHNVRADQFYVIEEGKPAIGAQVIARRRAGK